MRFLKYLLIGLFCVIGAGCNVFEGMDSPGATDDLGELLIDADIALRQNKTDQAVSILRHAHDVYPSEKRVAIKLSTALLEHHQIGTRQALYIARSLSRSSKVATAEVEMAALNAPLSNGSMPICSFSTDHDHESFQLDEIGAFADFDPSPDALAEIQALISEVLETENDDIDEFDPDNEETIDEAIERLENEGLSNNDIAEIMINDAVATLTVVYLDLSQEARDSYEFFYVTSPADEEYLGYCAPTQEHFDEAENTAACRADDVSWVNSLINKRVGVLDSNDSIAEEIATYSSQAYDIFTRKIGGSCTS